MTRMLSKQLEFNYTALFNSIGVAWLSIQLQGLAYVRTSCAIHPGDTDFVLSTLEIMDFVLSTFEITDFVLSTFDI